VSMADEPLSQDAIEALLAAHAAGDAEPVAEPVAVEAPSPVGELIADMLDPAAGLGPLVEAVELDALIPLDEEPAASADISMLLEVPLEISVELGRTRLTIRELLELGQGSILELDRHAGEPVDVLVNGRPLARGEVVVIDEDFGIRITDVVSEEERLRSMQD
jgi:flagellar motor switch protein FliN